MRRFLAAVGIAWACASCATAPMPPDTLLICLCDGGPGRDAGRDAVIVDPPPRCDGVGTIGNHCRSGGAVRCASSATCLTSPTGTVQAAFMLRQAGEPDPDHDGYRRPQEPAIAADDAPFNGAAGGLCALRCDPMAVDTCDACTSCSGQLTQMPLVAQLGGVAPLLDPATGPQGICRLDCTWDEDAASLECPDQMACDRMSNVCVEACTSDDECNTSMAVAYDGEVLTTIERTHPRRCDAVTGRCALTGSDVARVGAHCDSDSDCRDGLGVCMPGGRCAEFACPNPGTVTSTCGGVSNDLGICLATSAASRPSTLCLLGCNTADDCGAGNICSTLRDASGAIVTIGGRFTGYCIGTCASDDQCIASEACTDDGRCVPRCAGVGGIGAASGCADTEVCAADHDGASYGHCAPQDRFCGARGTIGLPAVSIECATGWVCDEMLALGREALGDGHCTPACTTDGDCGTGTTCVTTGPFAGLCRHACTTTTDCAASEACTEGWCVEG